MNVSYSESTGESGESCARTRTARAEAERTKLMMKGRWMENQIRAEGLLVYV